MLSHILPPKWPAARLPPKPNHRERALCRLSASQIIPSMREAVDQDVGAAGTGLRPVAGDGSPPSSGSTGLSWATLMKRVFALDVLLCPRCGGRRRIVGVYSGGQRLRDLLERLGLGDRSSRPAPEPSG